MTEPRIFESPDALRAAIGEQLGVSDWLTVDQQRVDLFAEATGDHQWIHTDVRRAAEGPFGSTIAHGYLTLSLLPVLTPQLLEVRGVRMALNYGVNKVRFPAPLPVGSRVRATGALVSVTDVPDGVQTALSVTVEREGATKPVCAAETVTRYFF
ncbi:MaoC family dehydratase [Streptomyces marincola]|uniref:Dehydratase n=1 Tax=Streptomyces marincola TaxID=2878388 RepID=A0A1W7D3L8_9ACTN|nr:MaoC family dehydratase [Streptomyces marincola]ARQ71527.1 dehydratase [Streptomyces marincola]UCM87028.1 MaoC family dehydratase [Streptomyces marincola]